MTIGGILAIICIFALAYLLIKFAIDTKNSIKNPH